MGRPLLVKINKGFDEGSMPFRNAVHPEHFEMLGRVLDAHCERFGVRSAEGRESVALSLLAHFQRGVSDEDDLTAIIADENHPGRLR